MAFFNFRRKLDAAKEYSLDDIPIFSSLNPAEQKVILKKARLVEFKRGDHVYQEGAASEAFYVVISGRFRVYSESKGNDGNTLFYAYRGDHFGETSLLTERSHSASVEAKRDGLILKLEKEDFLRAVREIPAISLYLNRSLGHRLTKSEEEGGRTREVKVCALYSNDSPEESLQFWFDFAARLHCDTTRKIIIVDFTSRISSVAQRELEKSSIPSFDLSKTDPNNEAELKRCITQHSNKTFYLHVPANVAEQAGDKKLPALITLLTYRFDYLMLRLENNTSHVTFRSLKKTDDVYILCRPVREGIISCSKVLKEFEKTYAFVENELKVIIPESEALKKVPYEEQERLLGSRIFSLLPLRRDSERYNSTIRFLSREFSGTLIGLALGSGAAYGLSHIGVMKVFEKENIPVDVISGSSIGALIGSFWAAGFKSSDLIRVAESITRQNAFFKLIGFGDLSIAHRGFIKGNRIIKFLQSYLGDIKFQELKIPLKIVATDLFGSGEVVFEAGRVLDGLRASISIPGIFRPFHYRGQILIDGGVIDPLPVRVLTKMGVKKIIAVNVLTSAKDRLEAARVKNKTNYSQLRSMAHKNLLSKGLEGSIYKLERRYSDNIFNVIMNTIQFMEYELADAAANEADVVLHPEITEGHWAQFYTPGKFIKAGEEEALEHLSDIKQLILE